MDEKPDARLLLADQFFAQATVTTEVAMRNSISRLYWASYHIAVAITEGKSHGDIAKRLGERYEDVGEKFRNLHKLRSQMDYWPDFFLRELGGKDPGDWYQEQMRDGIGLYDQLRAIWNASQRVKA